MKRMNRLISTFACAVAILVWTCAPAQGKSYGNLVRAQPLCCKWLTLLPTPLYMEQLPSTG